MAKPKYYRANQGFSTVFEGENVFVKKGELVSADHKLLKGREELFDESTTFGRFDTSGVEQATAAPGEKRGKSAKPKRTAKPKRAPRKPKATRSTSPPAVTTTSPDSSSSGHFGLTTKDIGEPQP